MKEKPLILWPLLKYNFFISAYPEQQCDHLLVNLFVLEGTILTKTPLHLSTARFMITIASSDEFGSATFAAFSVENVTLVKDIF